MSYFPYLAEGFLPLPSDEQLLAMGPDELFGFAKRIVDENPAIWAEFRQTLQRLGLTLPQTESFDTLPPAPAGDTHEFREGDQVQVTGNVQGQGETGTLVRFGDGQAFAVVQFPDGASRSYHCSDLAPASDEDELFGEKLVDDAAATADTIVAALQSGEWKQHVDEVSHLYPQPDQVIRAMGGNNSGVIRVVKQKLAAAGVDVAALGHEIQAAGSTRFGERTLAERLLEGDTVDPTQPKSPETKAIPWADQTYPGEGADDPDTLYPRKNPDHVL